MSAGPSPPVLLVQRSVAVARIEERIRLGQALLEAHGRESRFKLGRDPAVEGYATWDEQNSLVLNTLFSGDDILAEYRSLRDSLFETVYNGDEQHLKERLDRLAKIRGRIPLYHSTHESNPVPVVTTPVLSTNEVFIVHGHDEATKQAVARFVETLGLTPIILHEQANRGKTIIEKLENHAMTGFAVALLTPDDVGSAKANPLASDPSTKDLRLTPRARQNVIFELGYFIGLLGRARVCALLDPTVDRPSDYDGVVWIPLDGESWKLKLAGELRAAGLSVDLNRLLPKKGGA